MEFNHKTVLLNETVEALNPKAGEIYVDATFGGGGHSKYLLSICPDAKIIGIDQDMDAINNFTKGFKTEFDTAKNCAQSGKITLVKNNFENIIEILDDLDIKKVDGIMADLGVSSHQLDIGERGFSFRFDAPLDMRMNQNSDFSAYNVVNEYSLSELEKIIREYGEENWAKRIAETIVDRRKEKPIKTTFDLVDIIEKAVPKKLRDKGKHPATRTFQAIRIEVNGELEVVNNFIDRGFDALKTGGRMAIITFHSLEDRVVKQAFKDLSTGCTCPPEFPVCVCNNKELAKLINRKPIVPKDDELAGNMRSRSSKLRIIEKLRERE